MPNTGVKGRIVFAGTDDGIPNLVVQAVDLDPVLSEDALGTNTTDSDGRFAITYTSPNTYRDWFDRNPDIVVRVYTPDMRLLLETEEFSDVKQTVLDIDERSIHKNNVEGWLVTNATLDPEKGDPVFLSRGNQIEWLIDGAALFPKLHEAVKQAKHSVNLMNMMFRVASVSTNFKFKPGQNFDTVQDGDAVERERIQDLMKTSASGALPMQVVVWDALNVPGLNLLLDKVDTADDVADFFKNSDVRARAIEATLTLFHSKAMVVDGNEAFVMGSTLSQGYFSDQQHLIHDIRHGGTLMHDVSLRLTGPAVAHVDRTFATIWNASDPDAIPMTPARQASTPTGNPPAGVQVLRTLPGGALNDWVEINNNLVDIPIPHGETSVLEAYQRAIALAEEFIFIEDQYFVAPEIVDALLRRMKAKSDLEVILVLNPEPDIPSYPQKQIQFINQMRTELGADKNRLGVFTMWSTDDTKTPFEIMPIYIHSKTGIVDERWATTGTANIDGGSLNQFQTGSIMDAVLEDVDDWVYILLFPFIIPIFLLSSPLTLPLLNQALARPTQHANPRRSKQPPRQFEINVVVYNDVAEMPPTPLVTQLREDLWREHLGLLPLTRPAGGWVKFWEQQAADKVAAIKAKQKHPAKILPWVPQIEAKKYLEALGISPASLRLRTRADRYNFETLKWDYGG
jgi:phosphatidylserine/phosphatidylglycerophosphate/cardiolipin synthase-like enzyme